jgi:ABC-type dipeptide/oligopeptide/nickel transport system ATPase component
MVRMTRRRRKRRGKTRRRIKTGNQFFLRTFFAQIDVRRKPELRMGFIVGPPGSGKTTNAQDIFEWVLDHREQFGWDKEHVALIIEGDIPTVLKRIKENIHCTAFFIILDDTYDSLNPRMSMTSARIRSIGKLLRIRHLVAKWKKEGKIPNPGALICVLANCQSISGLDKIIREQLAVLIFKNRGMDVPSIKLANQYIKPKDNPEAIRALNQISEWAQDPRMEVKDVARSMAVYVTAYGTVGLLDTWDMHQVSEARDPPYVWLRTIFPEGMEQLIRQEEYERLKALAMEFEVALPGAEKVTKAEYYVFFAHQGQFLQDAEVARVRTIHIGLAGLQARGWAPVCEET